MTKDVEPTSASSSSTVYNYKAHYSLDCDNGIEKAVVQHPLTPEEILEDKQRPALAHTRVMYLFCRVFSCQCTNEGEKLSF